MQFGPVVHISQLKVGNVVRVIHGALTPAPGAPALQYPESAVVVEQTRGWRAPEIGGPGDFRQGYDAMTVVEVVTGTVSFLRPFLHVRSDAGTGLSAGFEPVSYMARDSRGPWLELLSAQS